MSDDEERNDIGDGEFVGSSIWDLGFVGSSIKR
jgi:hypothetical protein